jgi:hypothetical protein
MTADGPRTPSSGEKAPRHSSGARIYSFSVRALSLLFVALGLAVLAITLVNGGGPLSVGVLMGVAFLAVGAVRLWILSRMSR